MGICQWAVPLDADALIKSYTSSCMAGSSLKMSPDAKAEIALQVRYLKDVVTRLRAMNIDFTEFACLKAVALFKSGKLKYILFPFCRKGDIYL